MSEKLLTVREVAELLHITQATVRSWVLKRKIASYRVGGRAVRVPASEVDRVLREGLRPAREPLKNKG